MGARLPHISTSSAPSPNTGTAATCAAGTRDHSTRVTFPDALAVTCETSPRAVHTACSVPASISKATRAVTNAGRWLPSWRTSPNGSGLANSSPGTSISL